MAPTPTPNKRGTTVGASQATATSVRASMRTPAPQKPPRSPASQRVPSATGAADAPATSAMERLVDELSNTPRPAENDRQEAFESARKRFAMYGKQNAHVSHYSPDQQQALLARTRQRALKRQPSGAGASTSDGRSNSAARPPLARRTVEWEDTESTSSTGNTAALQNTVLLQENGELAAQLDEMEYHLDGILGGSSSVETEEQGYAMAASVVALTKLLQLEQVQTVLKVASQRQPLTARVRDVLLRLKTFEHRMLKLSVAVMAYLLTMSAEADEFFREDVIDGVVAALAVESKHLEGECTPFVNGESEQRGSSTTGAPEPSLATKTPLKKSFLKRKKSGNALGAKRGAELMAQDVLAENAQGDEHVGRTRAHAQRDEQLRDELCSLLRGHETFAVDGQIQLSTADLLSMLLHNILQVGGATGGEAAESSKAQTARHFHQRQDLAGTTFETIRTRKRQLLRNGGLALLLKVLEKRFERLQTDLDADLLHISVSLELVSAFQRVRTMLRVLDQASFLATDVQLNMSKDPMIFRVTLKLIEALSNLAWSYKSRKKWQNDPSFMQLTVDVLMAAMRVLINLSHQNEDANTHIAKLEGTKILFLAFCKLWGTVELEQASGRESKTHSPGMPQITEDKVVYDALLLTLSAITNCVEYSAENRAQLSALDISTTVLDGLEAFRSSSTCSLLVSFFVSKVQSYIHLFAMSDSQREMEGESWVPEDVVLGGCASLLLGCLMKDSSYNSATILGALPDSSPRLLLRALGAFVALHSQIGALTPEVGKSVLEVEKLLKSFMFNGDEPSPNRAKSSDSLAAVSARRSQGYVNEDPRGTGLQTEIVIQLKATPKQKRKREVEEVKGTDSAEDEEEPQFFQENPETVRSPPASAFKYQRFSRVCSNVDDSDEVSSDLDHSPAKKRPDISACTSLKRSPGRAMATVKATLTFTPVRRVSDSSVVGNRDEEEGQGKMSIQRRLKRTRQLVSDLEAEFMKIGSRDSSEINSTTVMTSTEDIGDAETVKLSKGLLSSQEVKIGLITPQKAPKKKRSNAAAKTPSAIGSSKNQKRTPPPSKKLARTPPTTHKRKLKATPAKAIKRVTAAEDANAIFDFTG